MLRNKIYYTVKPFLPWPVRMAIRRWFSRARRRRSANAWPIMPGSERPPAGWAGWPDGKKFALVLTHDVEGGRGLANCRPLMELEQSLGVRSSFNFVPEADYALPGKFREELVGNGFEVGVHDLRHDGKLYWTRERFARSAERINQYLRTWGASGFRSGFMLHKMDWLHDLEVEYDSSTFDTDPFEPQPEGTGTIFPFWVPRPNGVQGSKFKVESSNSPDSGHWTVDSSPPHSDGSQLSTLNSQLTGTPHSPGNGHGNGNGNGNGGSAINSQLSTLNSQLTEGYVELPYTLPQDSTLFLLFRERTPDIWLQKLDWIAKHGGMALLITHPDYMSFNGSRTRRNTYHADKYENFLAYVCQRYKGQYWQALPREVADFVRGSRLATRTPAVAHPRHLPARRTPKKPGIWIDLDNTPHVPFFEPIIEELRSRSFPLLVTARDAFQVYALADKKGLNYHKIGRHHGKHRLLKAAGLVYRALQLTPVVFREKPVLGVSHGARSQFLASNWLRIPTVLLEDYEHCQFPPLMRPTWVMAPDVIPDASLPLKNGHIRKYAGIKEDVYAWKLVPDPQVLKDLGLRETDLIVTVRPPATEAHYHNPQSEGLFARFMERANATPNLKVVLLPRNKKQAELIRHRWPAWFAHGKTIIPPAALDGLNLIWHSDLVVSGGGTMNREAAALRVPVYSIFRGLIGAVDKHLTREGRLVMIESVDDVARKIRLVKRPRGLITEITSRETLKQVVDTIQEIAEKCARGRKRGSFFLVVRNPNGIVSLPKRIDYEDEDEDDEDEPEGNKDNKDARNRTGFLNR